MNGLAQITIDGQPVVLKFGLPAVRRIMLKMAEQDLMDGDYYTEIGLCHVLYAGYLNACAMRDEIAKIPFQSFYEFVENGDDDLIKQEIVSAMRSFEESKYVKDALGKKKAATSQSNHVRSTGTK